MLRNLHVKNLALIEETEVEFRPGLNIMSGETGAGKSIIIGSINLALGEKVQKSMLRDQADYSLVELTFSVENPDQIRALEAMDLYPEDSEIILSRKIMKNGRSVCRINSETVSASMMRKAASLLIDIHGQHEHQSLLSKKNHMKYLDGFARKDLAEPLKETAALYHAYDACKKELEEASLDAEQRARELSFLEFEINEICEAELSMGEDEELEQEFRRLSNGQKILEAVMAVRDLCADGMSNASDAISRAAGELVSVAAYDENLEQLADQLGELDGLLNDFNRDLADYADSFDYSEERFHELQSRLDIINHLKSKYGRTIELILASLDEKEMQAEKLRNFDAYKAELETRLQKLEKELAGKCQIVSDIRKAYAKQLTLETTESLKDLNFLDVRFEMDFSKLPSYTANGWDEARFLISTNPGEPMKPLDSVASGGELSRIMLALKTVLAENDDIETLIFDEIDSGISGRTAQMVAEKMKMTASDHQIICITHLPQIAAMADAHFLIEKTAVDTSTISDIHELDRERSIIELARMLGGVKITDAVLQNAREMRDLAESLSRS